MKNNGKSLISKIIYAYTAYVQAPIIFITNVAICILPAYYFTEKYNLPNYVMVIAIILGVLSGVYGMFKYLHIFLNKSEDKNDNRNTEKNQ